MKENIIGSLKELIKQDIPQIEVNLINCGKYVGRVVRLLESAGYKNTTPGHPQPIFKKEE